MNDLDLRTRAHIYDALIRGGPMPRRAELTAQLRLDVASVDESLRRLADEHMLVLSDDGEIHMANPFSGVATPFKVRSEAGEWWANCIWDSLGIAAMLGREVTVESHCPDCGEALTFNVEAHGPKQMDLIAHFAVPAAHWWDDIVFT